MSDYMTSWGVDELDGNSHTLVANRLGQWEVMIGGGPDAFVLTATAIDELAAGICPGIVGN